MKATFIGGGAHRLLGILRGALSDPHLFDGGEICLYDLNAARAETLGLLLMRTPEYARVNCRVTFDSTIEDALSGADVVSAIFPAGSQRSASIGDVISQRHGYITSDNVSPNGAMHALKAGPALLDIARKMERYCPSAWFLDFVNPIAVFSGMINHHTGIRALGVCAGFSNHQWDIARLLGSDRQIRDIDVEVAGINHLSFILNGSVEGAELFSRLDESFAAGWSMPELGRWSEPMKTIIKQNVSQLVRIYADLGILMFSTEPDGLEHLYYDEAVDRLRARTLPVGEQLDRLLEEMRAERDQADCDFRAHLERDLPAEFWTAEDSTDSVYSRVDDDIFIRILRGVAGLEAVNIVTSRPNEGAVTGFDDRTVVEYSQTLLRDTIKPRGSLDVAPVVRGIVTSLAVHQTMLGDAIATEDPRLLAHALLSYPWQPHSSASRRLFRDLIDANADEIAEPLRSATQFLNAGSAA